MVNKVILIGNLGRDPETKRFENGSMVAKFPLATNESYKDKNGEWQTNTEWHNIVSWGGAAERVEKDYKKGSLVFVEGKLTTRKWQDESGKDNYITEVRAMVLRKLERREANDSYGTNLPSAEDEFPPLAQEPSPQKSSAPAAPASTKTEGAVEDDLPF